MKNQQLSDTLDVGIDIGSTTTKITAIDRENGTSLYSDYQRHHASQIASVTDALKKFASHFPGKCIRLALTGSGAKSLSEALHLPYIQEVVAGSISLKNTYKKIGSAIELGGQDAKILFFREDPATGQIETADMRMNGSCAGGTGAFIDEVASILNVPVEEFDALAAQGSCVYDVSGRCGVYAKTDIQPLLNQGVPRKDLALSAFHAIAKQTIGGLAQGLTIEKPVAFQGGPLTFNPTLVKVFAERLELSKEDILIPTHPELMIARGAALSIPTMFANAEPFDPLTLVERLSGLKEHAFLEHGPAPFFSSKEEQEAWEKDHALPDWQPYQPQKGETVRAYLGLDSGSTTTKFVLLGEDKTILDSFYAPGEGEPLKVAKQALLAMKDRYEAAGATLTILGVGTTGYGEQLFAKALSAECHVVETVAHARAALEYVPDVTFLLDIGGQDMKAIWMDDGIITNIVVNEACSSGCGSFLENFASSLHIPVDGIAPAAFDSETPASLGSRCTVFMNSSIVTEQRNGKQPGDIMAGLCRSIIENVFTKVIRVSNLNSLGDHIVVQGGTFRNNAVLRALEQYTGRTVTRAPYPGIMGAIGAALLTKERMESGKLSRSFIGLDALKDLSYTQEANSPCPFCGNHCRRTVITFSNGASWVTNNRCERGEILGDPKNPEIRKLAKETLEKSKQVPDLFAFREKLLFEDYPFEAVAPKKEITIGLPRVLAFWDNMPFWKTFFLSLGFSVQLSDPSNRKMYESGLSAVTSDTVCFPAKLVHGHLRNLAEKKVDRIFMPSLATLESENTQSTSQSMCAVVKGYPIVIRNSDNPTKHWNIPFDAPLFYWYSEHDKEEQLCHYMEETFSIPRKQTSAALAYANEAQSSFRAKLRAEGKRVLEEVSKNGGFAVVLASRPYQNDRLVNHDLPSLFTALQIPVLTADSVPGIEDVDLSKSALDVVNNFHARMLSSAIIAASHPNLEYVQTVSFGCGHDAYLSDEIIRLMKEISGKTPLVLKLDESDIRGPLNIRVRSFVETLSMKRAQNKPLSVHELSDPYPVKFTQEHKKTHTVLIPNTSHAFCRLMSAAMKSQKIQAVPLAIGRDEAIRLGKRYVHNDICFPAQIVIGEALEALQSGKYDPDCTAIGMGKYIGDCRLTHYSTLLRKALDDAGFSQVPILTNDDADSHNLHPGYRMNLKASLEIAFGLPMIDALEELLRKVRPYETVEGSADAAFDFALDALIEGLEKHGIPGMRAGFAKGVERFCEVPYECKRRKPGVLIVGEYLLNFHPGANHDIEAYLEKNGFEVIEAKMTDVIQKTYFARDTQISQYHLGMPLKEKAWYRLVDHFFDLAHAVADQVAKKHPLYERAVRLPELVKTSDPVIHHSFDAGEGVLIPGEILHHAAHGCRAFVILQPFGCLPNHVVGRGIVKKLKELYPDAKILTLDYDPDVSFANVENRLQMLVMNVKEQAVS